MLAAWPLLIAVVARLPSCSWESGGAVTVAINITSFASPCATDSNSAEKVRSHIRLYLGGSPGFARSGWSAACSSVTASISSPRDLSPAGECSECRRSIFTWLKRRSPTDRRMACPTTGGCQASVLAGYWSAAFVLLIAALSALYARRGHARASPDPLPMLLATIRTDSALAEETKPCHRPAARRRARRPAAKAPVAADASDGSSEADSDDECLERLLQLHRSPAHRVADATRTRSPTVAAQPTQSAASAKREPPEEAWDAVATPRKRTVASCAPAACPTEEPRALPDAGGTADASDDQLEDWGELYSAHSKVRCAPGSYSPNPNHSDTHAALCRCAGCFTQAQGQAQSQRAHSRAAPVLH